MTVIEPELYNVLVGMDQIASKFGAWKTVLIFAVFYIQIITGKEMLLP